MKVVGLAILIFCVCWYLSTVVADYRVGIELPGGIFIGTYPLAWLTLPLRVLGGLFAVIVLVKWKDKGKEDS